MTRKKTALIIFTLFMAVPASLLLGHGVKVTVTQKPPIVTVHASYHGGRALPDAAVTVRFQKETKPFKKGRTDTNGDFTFSPDKPGEWTVMVDDLTGHRKKLTFKLDQTFFPPPAKEIDKNEPADPETASVKEPETDKTDPTAKEDKKKEDKKKDKPTPPTKSDMYWYLGKILLGVLLIAVVSYIMHRLVSKTDEKK